jgi:hypothetical protein
MAGIDYFKSLLRRWKWVVLTTLLGIVGLFVVTGYTPVIYAPRLPQDPVAVYLLVDDRHRGVLLPRADGGFVEYGYGDWDWYAQNYDNWHHAFDTVLWPTQGTLGRRFSASRNGEELRRQFNWMQLHELMVARKDMEALRKELADSFAKGADRQVYNERYRMTFVPHDESYWCLYNCNDVMTLWCEKLGCSVTWVPISLDFAVGKPR